MRYLDIEVAPKISKIGLGTWQFGAREWGYGEDYDSQAARQIVNRAIDLGVTLFDTAEIYGFGRSERILGEALGERRASVFLATKLLPLLPLAPVVEQRAVASANRLGTRRLDLYIARGDHVAARPAGDPPGGLAVELIEPDRAAGDHGAEIGRVRAEDEHLSGRQQAAGECLVLAGQAGREAPDHRPVSG